MKMTLPLTCEAFISISSARKAEIATNQIRCNEIGTVTITSQAKKGLKRGREGTVAARINFGSRGATRTKRSFAATTSHDQDLVSRQLFAVRYRPIIAIQSQNSKDGEGVEELRGTAPSQLARTKPSRSKRIAYGASLSRGEWQINPLKVEKKPSTDHYFRSAFVLSE